MNFMRLTLLVFRVGLTFELNIERQLRDTRLEGSRYSERIPYPIN